MAKSIAVVYGIRLVVDSEGNPVLALTQAAGTLIQKNFLELMARVGPSVMAAGPPTADNDFKDTAGIGVAFTAWSQWLDTDSQTYYVCQDAGTTGGDAVWVAASAAEGSISDLYQAVSEKDQPDGYAGLDGDGLLSPDVLPDIDGGLE